ncbi:MAG: radical SAM protein, partial [Candidatus Omnitrophota bacterium]
LELRKGWISLSFSRGCPFNCNFCINHRMKAILGANGYVRQKSVKNSIRELLDLIKKFPSIKVFNFEDDILIFNKSWTNEFMQAYKEKIYKKYGVKFKIEARVDLINETTVKELKEAGCQEVQFGVETGNSKLRNFILNKAVSDEQIISAFDLCRQYKINTLAFVMLGIPGETEHTVMDTIRMLTRIKSYLIRPSFIFPIYGTEFYKYCKKNGLLKEGIDRYENYLWTQGVPVRLNNISEGVLLKYMVFLPWYINAELGLKGYDILIKEYSRGEAIIKDKSDFEPILKIDRDKSRELSERNISHYHYFNGELNYLQYKKGD